MLKDIPALIAALPGRYLILSAKDPAFTILAVTDAFTVALRQPREQLLGRRFFTALPSEHADTEALTNCFRRVIKMKKAQAIARLELGAPKAGEGDKTRYWNSLCSPVIGEDGRVQFLILAIRDITGQTPTGQEIFTEELHNVNEELEQQVKERTAQLELMNADLQRLIDVNKAKDEFISLASHQLRTPATGVKQYVGMLLQGFAGELADMQYEMLIKAYESNERQLQIVSDLLKVARVDSGRVRLVLEKIELHQLIEDVLKEQQGVFAERQQEVHFRHGTQSPVVNADKNHLRMVLENLVDNASKYSPDGQPITITIRQDAINYRVAIKDQGVGISPKDRQKLFQKFSRIDNPLSTIVGGTGLGLYWAKQIIDLHGGDIEVTSRLGHGATFTVCLPKTA